MRRIGRIYGSPVVVGDSNLVTGNEIYLTKENSQISLFRRGSDGRLRSITGEEGERLYNRFAIAVTSRGVGTADAGTFIDQLIEVDGHDGQQIIEVLVPSDTETSVHSVYMVAPDTYKVGDMLYRYKEDEVSKTFTLYAYSQQSYEGQGGTTQIMTIVLEQTSFLEKIFVQEISVPAYTPSLIRVGEHLEIPNIIIIKR